MLDAREDIPSKRLGIEIHLTEGFWRKIYGRKNSFVAAPTTKVKTTFNLTSKTSPKVYLYIHQNYEDLLEKWDLVRQKLLVGTLVQSWCKSFFFSFTLSN